MRLNSEWSRIGPSPTKYSMVASSPELLRRQAEFDKRLRQAPGAMTSDIFLDQVTPSMQVGLVVLLLVSVHELLPTLLGGKAAAGAAVGGGSDLLGQYTRLGEGDQINPWQTAFAALTGAALGPLSNGNVVRDMGLGALNSVLNAEFQNVVFPHTNPDEDNSLIGAAVYGSIFGLAGNQSASLVKRKLSPTIRLDFNPSVPVSLQPMVMPNIWIAPASAAVKATADITQSLLPAPTKGDIQQIISWDLWDSWKAN